MTTSESQPNNTGHFFLLSLLLILAAGVLLRLLPSASFDKVGFDEHLYRTYVDSLRVQGVSNMPSLVREYIETQRQMDSAILPPTRFFYIFCAYLWSSLLDIPSLDALHDISAFWSVFTLGLAALFAYRLGGPKICLGVTALMACAPMQIHMSQHALIDGFFAFWALLSVFLLWENLRATRPDPLWLACLFLSLCCMVLTKENAFFVFIGLCGLILFAPLLGYGKLSIPLLLVTVLGPACGVITLMLLSGGPENFFSVYLLLVQKAYTLQYAIMTGDGPWYRYLVDLLLASPLILILTFGALFRLEKKQSDTLYLALFIGLTYLIMCNIKYGMNLRYTNMWDMPMRYLAFGQLCWLAARWPTRQALITCGGVVFLCLYDLRQYKIFFVDNPLYELVSAGLLRALLILK